MRFGPPMWATVVLALAGCTPEPPVAPTPPGVPSAPSSTAPSPVDPPDASAATASGVRPLFVREVRVDCEGEGPQKCLQVRASPTAEWTLLYDGIEGFHYEEGHAYELKVTIEMVIRPPADSASRRYHLVEVVSKTRAP